MAGNDKEVVAKVGVDVEPKLDTKKLKEQLGEIVKQGNLNDKKITIGSKLDLTGLKDSLEKVPSQVNLNNKSVTIKSKLDLTGLTDALNKISSQPNFNNKHITVGVKLDTSKLKESVDKLATNKLLNSKKITVGANLDLTKIKNSIKDINKTKLNIQVDLTNLKEVARQLSIIRNLVRGKHNGINNIPLDIKGGVSSRSSKRRKSDDSPLDVGFKKGGTSSDVDSEYKSLLQKRKEALDRADRAWQESKSKNTPNYHMAKEDFIKANKEYTEFAQKTGKLSLSGLIKQYENMLGSSLGKTNPIREEIEKLWKEAIKRQDELAKELASKNPLNQLKAAQEQATLSRKVQDTIDKANEASRNKGIADQVRNEMALIREELALLKEREAALRAEQNIRSALAKVEARQQKKTIADDVKNKFTLEKESRQGAAVNDAIANLKQGMSAGLPTSEVQRLRDELRKATEQYLEFRRQALSFDKNAEAKLLGNIAGKVTFDTTSLDAFIKKAQEAKQAGKSLQDQIKVPPSSTAQTFAAEAKRYAAEAEKAWRDAGNKSTPEFEKLRKQFMDTMNQMVRFRREIGDLSAGQAAGVYSKMASSLGKLSPLYDGLIKKARELNKEQARVNQEAKGDQSGGRWFGGAATYMVHFIGRSSKGFGSFGEAVADLAAKLQGMGGHIGRLGTAMALTSAAIAGVIASLGVLKLGFDFAYGTVTFFGNILQQIGTTIYNILKPGIELYKQQTSAMFSLTASLKSNAKYFKDKDSVGESLTTPEARGLSRDIINRATLDAEMSAFSLEELLRSLQGTLPILLSKGFSLDQAYKINKGVAGVSKMIQLTPSQILQETRDLAQGSITSRGSQVANALGISNADIAKYKGNADELFDYLMGKFKEYSELLNSYENTALGRWQQLEERWQTVTKMMVEGVETQFQALFEELINMTGSWVDRAGNKLNAITGKWEDKYGNVYDDKKKKFYDNAGNEVVKKPEELANVGKGYKFELSDPLKDALKALQDLVDFTLRLVDKFKEFVVEATNGKEPIEVIKDTIEIIEILFESILEKIVGFCVKLVEADEDGDNLFLTLYNGANAFYSVLEDVYARVTLIYLTIKKWSIAIEAAGVALGLLLTTGGVGNVVTKGAGILSKLAPIAANSRLGKMAVSGVEKVSSKIGDLTGWWSSASKTQKIGAGMAGAGAGAGIYEVFFGDDDDEKLEKEIAELKDKIDHKLPYQPIKSMDEFRERSLGSGSEASKRRQERQKQLDAERKALENDPTKDPNKAKGTPSSEISDKDRKAAIKDAQKAMREHIQGLKEQLKDHIAELKETLAKNKIAFDEGFMTVKDYFTQKAQIELEEARARLEEAQAEKAAILATPYENQADQLKALHTVEREIRQQTRAVNKSVKATEEVARATGKYAKAVELLRNISMGNNAVDTTPVVGAGGQQISASKNQSAIESFAGDVAVKNLSYVANEITNQAIAKLGNNERGWTLAKLANAIAAAESHYNQGATSASGAVGIMQLMPDTAESLGVNPYDWKQNIAGGIKYILQLLDTFNWSIEKAVAAYNAGPGAVKNYGGVPPYRETQGYVSRVTDYIGRIDSNGFNASTGGNAQVIQSASQTMLDQIGTLLVYNINEYVSKGIPYVWGGTSEAGFDCSGMVKYLFDQLGISIQRTADYQFDDMKSKGSIFDNKDWLLPGDLVFMRGSDPGDNGVGHVGIYAGNNQMVHMPGSGRQAEYANLDNRHDIVGYGSVRNYTYGTPIGQMVGVKASNAISQIVPQIEQELYKKLVDNLVLGDAEAVIQAIKQSIPDESETGAEAYKAVVSQLSTLTDIKSELASRITGNQTAGVAKLAMQYLKNIVDAEGDKDLIEAYTEKFKNDLRDYRTSIITQMLTFTLDDMKYKGESLGNDIIMGRANFGESLAKYAKNVFEADPTNPNAPGNYYKQLEALYREYEAKGDLNKAVEIRNSLDTCLTAFQDVVKGWIDKGTEYIDKQQAIFDADSKFTSIQRDFGKREFEAYRAEYEYNRRTELSVALGKRLEYINRQLNLAKKNEKELVALHSDDEEINKKIALARSEINRLGPQRSQLEMQQRLNELERKRLELLKQQPEYLEDLKNTANDALANGLVTFLTDGVNEAESLGEALRNLAVSILKEIQTLSAKWMVKSLMNKLVGQYTFQSPEEITSQSTSLALNELRQQTMYQSQIVNLLSGGAINTSLYANNLAGVTRESLVPGNNMLNLSYDEYMENKANPYKFNPSDYEISGSAVAFKSSIDEFKLSNTELINANMANTAATTADTAVEQASVSLDTAAKITDQESNALTAENNVQLANVSAQLSSVTVGSAHASGGYITGPGTGTSDSIPARLSAGEYVIKAEAVKRMGVNYLNAINNGNFTKIKTGVHHYAQGGLVSDLAQEQTARGISNFGKDISNNISNTANISVALVRDEQEGMKQLLRSPEGQRIMLDFSRRYASVTSRF